MAVEIFTALMEEAQREGCISGVKLAPTVPVITHLLFADDCILLAKAKEEELYQSILILNRYTDASGQKINLEKSGIVFGQQVPIQTRVNIEEIMGMQTWEIPWVTGTLGKIEEQSANVDAAYSRSTAEGATAIVIRDNFGRLLTEESMRIRAHSSLAAEAEAMRRALILATNLNMEQILIESDNLPLVQAVKSKTYIGEVESIIRDIFLLAESLSNCGFTWVPREGNKVADGVAKCSLAGQLEEN
ncbi:uncharacterized protein [Arachis hypogaea]